VNGPGAGAGARALAVFVDGEAMPEEAARAFWARFSAHMEEHKGDLKGFAEAEGFASVHPSMQGGRPVLLASRSAPQKAYTAVDKNSGNSGGSSAHQGAPRDPGRPRRSAGKPPKRRP
jgi:hypothetical protein